MEVGGQPQGYLALRVWRKSGLPLHLRSRRCTPPIRFSVSSLRALEEQECKRGGVGWGGGERERDTYKQQQFVHVKHFKTIWEKRVIRLKTCGRGGGSHLESAVGWRDRQCFGRPIKRKDSIMGRVTPPQSESSINPQHHEREGEKKEREKHKNTKRRDSR